MIKRYGTVGKRRFSVIAIGLIMIFSILNPILAFTLGEKDLNPLAGGGDMEPQGTMEVKTLARINDPVVVFAHQVPDLNGTRVSSIDVFSTQNDILVYAWDGANGTWNQIPFQVDERNPITGSWAVDYKNGFLDVKDEIVFMSKDAGDRASSNEWVVGCNAPRYEIEIVDPNTGGSAWAYIYKSSTIEADFTEDYVSFDYSVNDISTDSYSIGFRDGIGMIMDYFNVTEEYGGDGEDLVDTFEVEARAQILWFNEVYDENDLAADFTLKKDAHVRALGVVSWQIHQSMMGVTVDAYMNFTWKFNPEYVTVEGHVKFDINGGVRLSMWLALDLISSAIPLDYRDESLNTAVVNGMDDDNINDPVVQYWWEVSSSHGGYVCAWDVILESESSGLKFDDDANAQDHDNAEPGLYGRTGAYFNNIAHHQEADANFSFYPIASDVSGVAESILYNMTHPLEVTATAQHSPTIWVGKSVDVTYAGSGNSYVWVNVPHIDANSDTDYIWMYYGNPDASDVQDESETYDDNYVMVQHLQEKSGLHYDSTSYNNDGHPEGILTQDVTGVIDGADYFDGIDDYFEINNSASLNITNKITLEAWINTKSLSTQQRIIYKGFSYVLRVQPPYYIQFYPYDSNGSFNSSYAVSYTSTQVDTWYHVVCTIDTTLDADQTKLYINGDLADTAYSDVSLYTSDQKLYVGSYMNNGYFFNGTIDEVRISNVARSADWIKAQYLSMNNYFITYGDEEAVTWYPSWSYRKRLTFDNSEQSESQANFPFLVVLNPSNFDYLKAKYDGVDLRFVASDNVTELKYHIEHWDNGNNYARYTIYFNNTGDRDTNFVWINDTLPSKVTFLGHDAETSPSSSPFLTDFNQIGRTLCFEFQDVPQGVHSFNITVKLNSNVNLAEIITNWVFCNFTNHILEMMPESSAFASFEVIVAPSLPNIQVAKCVDKTNVLPGDILQYTIYFNNTGLGPAETVWINETLPAEVTYLSDSSETESGIKTGDHTWVFTNVAPGDHLFVINVSVGSYVGGTPIDNFISLAYTALDGIELPGSQAWSNASITYYQILKQGWNLISIPLIQEEQSLISALASIDGLYDKVQWYNVNDGSDFWKHKKDGKPMGNDLFSITESMGFWIYIIPPGDTVFSYNGIPPSVNQNIDLHKGWNLVGYPSISEHNRTDGLNNLEFGLDVDCIQWFDATTKIWHFLEDGDSFVPGRGYWMHTEGDLSWEVPL